MRDCVYIITKNFRLIKLPPLSSNIPAFFARALLVLADKTWKMKNEVSVYDYYYYCTRCGLYVYKNYKNLRFDSAGRALCPRCGKCLRWRPGTPKNKKRWLKIKLKIV